MKAHSTSDAARFAAVFTGLLLLASVPVALAADTTGLRSQAAGLQARSGSLEERAAAATLELYSLEAQLDRARTELADIDARRATLAHEQASARTQLAVARQALLASQSELWTSPARSTSSRVATRSPSYSGPNRSRRLSRASTASAARPARTTGSSSRRGRHIPGSPVLVADTMIDFARLRDADLDLDLAGRDFTINALAIDLNQPDRIIDPFNGQADLEEGVIRAIGETSLTSDPVRMLRAVRQSASLAMAIDPQTAEWIKTSRCVDCSTLRPSECATN